MPPPTADPADPSTSALRARLRATGARFLAPLAPLVDAADPRGTVSPRSRLLCAALAELALAYHRALGGAPAEEPRVGLAAAALALVTKVDDQVIDAPAFHGGTATPRAALRAKTRAYLAPTLAAIQTGTTGSPEGRCALAARLGAMLREIPGDRARRAHLVDVIVDGWAVQVDAVAVFTAHPGDVDAAEVARVTAAVSAAWLSMVTLVGALPERVARGFTADEARAFDAWGGWIQRADALADLARDRADGLVATFPVHHAWRAAGAAALDDLALYDVVAATGADAACLPGAAARDALAGALPALGDVGALLGWIRAYLVGRYLAHPRCRRSPRDEAFAPHVVESAHWPDG